jgi:hypothetical protein
MSAPLLNRLHAAARANHRSINSELICRLERSFVGETPLAQAETTPAKRRRVLYVGGRRS